LKSLIWFTSGRRDGDARQPSDLLRLLKKHGVPPNIATGRQVHDVRLRVIERLDQAQEFPGFDGFLTDVPGQPLGIFTADCASIFLSAPSRGVVGLLHAGWRGVRSGILRQALLLMRKRWRCRSKDVQVWLGPSIGGCCFQVQWDVARYFPATRRRRGDRWTVDIARELQLQATRLGASFLKRPVSCTHHKGSFHSFRRDQTKERQISVIMKVTN
jgi:polyphenol oxidase